MKLRKIEFVGLKAFVDKATFTFGREPGLYFLQGGENRQDPALGSNGVGKSTIWSILCWILFGKTPDGLRAGDLQSWQSNRKGYKGKLWIGRSVIERTWRPNSLTYDGQVVSQAELEDRVGIDFDTFVTTVLISQGEPMFFDLSAVRKLSIFTSLLQLDEWIEYSDAAKLQAADLQEAINKKAVIIGRTEGQLDGLDVGMLKEKKENFRSERYNEMTSLQPELRELKADSKKLTKRIAKAKSFKEKMRVQLEGLDADSFMAKEARTILKNESVVLNVEWVTDQAKHTEILQKQTHLRKHKGKLCLVCGQKVTATVAKKQIVGLGKQAMVIDEDNLQRSVKLREAKEEIEALDGVIKKHDFDYRKTKRRLDKFDGQWEDLQADYSDVKAAVKILAAKLKDVHTKKNPFAPMLKAALNKEKELLGRLKKRKSAQARLEARQDLTEYWVKGFKDVRLYLIDEALQQLEVETNRALAELGFSSDWSIKYLVERTSKQGRAMVGFSVLVNSPYSDKQVPFAAWSGGEKQRLKIAGSMGFMSLVSARTGLDLGLEVYDEPTQHLSPQGIDSLLEALRIRALETGKRIWLVDHHTLDYGDFTATAIVNKDEGGRSTVWQS